MGRGDIAQTLTFPYHHLSSRPGSTSVILKVACQKALNVELYVTLGDQDCTDT